MYNFNMNISTELFFGEDAELKAGALMRQYGRKILLIYGSRRIFEEGLGQRLVESLEEAGCTVVCRGGVKPNAEIAFIEQTIEIARQENIEGILAVGGGSVIDTAKAVSAGSGYRGSVRELYENPEAEPCKYLPIGAVVTMPASASECNDMSVISDHVTGRKIARPFKGTRPKFALLNPQLTLAISRFQTACGGVDILSHAVERYFDLTRKSRLLDGMTESLMRTVIEVLPKVLMDPENLEMRGELMLAASAAHSDMLGPGGDFACHEISHVLTEKYGITHGSALAMILPAWCQRMSCAAPERFCRFFERVWGITGSSWEEMISRGIDEMRRFITEIGLPLTIPRGDYTIEELTAAVGTPGGTFARLTEKDVEAILRGFVA